MPAIVLSPYEYNFTSETEDSKLQLSPAHIRSIIARFLSNCNLIYPTTDPNIQFMEMCIQESEKRGYIIPEDETLKRFIPGGVAMARNAYLHQSMEIQVYTCLYTAFLIYLDDMFERDITPVQEFNHNFVTRTPHKYRLLQHFDALLLEMPSIFGTVVANMMTTSTLNLVTALLLEAEMQGVHLPQSAGRYPTFGRVMSGASETYALFAFPPHLPLKSYLPALPDMMVFINNGNDILSFYKEELAGETVNRVHLLAQSRGVKQSVTLEEILDDAVEARACVLRTLSINGEACDAWESFCQGYIGFHAGLKRYRLSELGL